MAFNKKTVKDINLSSKTVLLRADYNVPLNEQGHITDDYRITQSIPTIEYLLSHNVKLIICSHLGRPSGPGDKACSLKVVEDRLRELLPGKTIHFANDCIGDAAKAAASKLEKGQILLLENLRFHPEEEANDPEFAKQLASSADVFVQDGFGVVHRAHASTEAITKFLPSVAGLLLEKEVTAIEGVINDPKKPLMTIIGGAKIADKIAVLETFIKIADVIAIGGAMANTFLAAQKIPIGKSKADLDDLSLARDILAKAEAESKKRPLVFYYPHDVVVSNKIDKLAPSRIVDWSANVVAEIENYPKQPPKRTQEIGKDEMILDIGPFSAAFIAGLIQQSGTVIWNGTMGITEVPSIHGPIGPYAHGTETVIEAMLGEFGHRPYSLVGGGDTAGYVVSRKLADSFDHVSTGGGASLELMTGNRLPGIEALENK